MKRRARRSRNPLTRAEERILDSAREQATRKRSGYVVSTIDNYVNGDDAADLQERYTPGDYFAKAADEAWEFDDVIFDSEVEAANAYEILRMTALKLGGDPLYGRKRNSLACRLERNARDAVRLHASDRRWKQMIPGGTKRAPASFDRQALVRGTTVELEHTTDPLVALEIAMDHLDEDPHHYDECPSRTRRPNPDPAACALGKWAWDRDPAPCGRNTPSPSQAGRDLAKKRWTLPERERRLAARILV